jgi:hypothetical protein
MDLSGQMIPRRQPRVWLCEAENAEKIFPTPQASTKELLEWLLIPAWFWPGGLLWEKIADSIDGIGPSGFAAEADEDN